LDPVQSGDGPCGWQDDQSGNVAVISIQSGMLVALGFLAASLLALVIAPAFWARAVRLTTRRIKDAMPITDIEIRADKDRIRAEYAVEVHKLETQMEQVRLATARQQIELNRRDAGINELQGELERLQSAHEEAQNARRVLEQTVADRLPRVEQRLTEARQLLLTRDREVSELTRGSEKQSRALNEAIALHAQQQSELDRLGSSLATRGARNQGNLSDPRFDGEVALRAELEALRAKTRDQAQLLTRMQSLAARPGASTSTFPAANGETHAAGSPAVGTPPAIAPNPDVERELRTLKARTEDQAGEIIRLKTALAVFESDDEGDGKLSFKESKIALRARIQSIEAQAVQQTEIVQRLRSELAAANERLAHQAAHFTSELKRLGAGTLPASGKPRNEVEPPRFSLTQRVARAAGGRRLGAMSAVTNARSAAPSGGDEDEAAVEIAAVQPVPANDAAMPSATVPDPTPAPGTEGAEDAKFAREGGDAARPRLLDRIAGIGRPS
jgi:hypothetical protein